MDDLSLRLDHVVIAVSEWERSNAFYRGGPGQSVSFRDPDGTLLELISYVG